MSFYAFKGFDKDLGCRDFQYEVGKTYSMPEKPEICVKGFHCCTKLSDVFLYYPPWTWDSKCFDGNILPVKRFPSENRYCLVEVFGDVDTEGAAFGATSKIATNGITIIQELFIEDIIRILEQEADEAKRACALCEGIAANLKRINQPERKQKTWSTGTM